MNPGTYPAARAVASKVQEYYTRHLNINAHEAATQTAILPKTAFVEAVIDVAFWASLRREEGYVPKISLALLAPEQAPHPLIFEQPLPLRAAILTRLAPAVERPGIHLGVWPIQGELFVWGTTRSIPKFCFVVEVVAPGLLVIKVRRSEDVGKFVNIAVLEGDEVKMVDRAASSLLDGSPLLSSLLGSDIPSSWPGSVGLLVQVAVSMREHGHGGSLLVVPAHSETWRDSIMRPIPYPVSPPLSELAELMREHADERRGSQWHEAVYRSVAALAGLTAVDGATVITNRYEVLAFGAKISRRYGWPQIDQIVLTEPIEGRVPGNVHPAQLGGTRHISAAQFVQDQTDAFAFVASQDGRFTIFEWSSDDRLVHANRIETLLL